METAELWSELHARFAISMYISLVIGLLRLSIVSSRSCACINFEVMFSLSERLAGMVNPRYSKSLLILWMYLKTVLDLGLQSRINFSMKQATTRSYPGSFPQGSGINFCLHHFKYWACLNRSVSIGEPCLSLASFASIKCPKSFRAVLDSVGRKDNVSIPHDPVEGLQSHIETRKDCEWNGEGTAGRRGGRKGGGMERSKEGQGRKEREGRNGERGEQRKKLGVMFAGAS